MELIVKPIHCTQHGKRYSMTKSFGPWPPQMEPEIHNALGTDVYNYRPFWGGSGGLDSFPVESDGFTSTI